MDMPVHVSAMSQMPAAGRHTAPTLPAGCWQASWTPSHWSSVHGFVSAVHDVKFGFFVSGGHVVELPSQVSA
jgi:hypothetical protein